jgi:phosphate transport system substrate-binding protein
MAGLRILLAAVLLLGSAGYGSPVGAAEQTLRIGGTGSALGGAQQLLDGLTKRRPEITGIVLPSVGTSGAIKAVIAGALDIGLTSRPLKTAERSVGLVAQPYGTTAVVFAVRRDNPRSTIRSTEIVDIYEERITAWGDGTPIRFILRPPSDGDTEILMRFLPRLASAWQEAAEKRIAPVAYTDQEAAEMVETIPGSFGPNSLSLVLAERRPIKALALDGVAATVETIRNGTYDLTKTFHFITRPETGGAVRAFLDFAASPEGRDILESVGIVPLRDGK